jgi:mannose/cellobiose epimerase-like protein (N-acyl-D-glucosamine 2-epimerase family)
MPFEMSNEFPLIPEHSGTRDFSRASCQNPDMHLPAGLAAWMIEFEPVPLGMLQIASATKAVAAVRAMAVAKRQIYGT